MLLVVIRQEWAHFAKTYSRCGAKVQQDLTLLQEAILLVQLDELKSSTGTITLLFRELVPLVQTAFAVLLLDSHGVERLYDYEVVGSVYLQYTFFFF